MHDIFCERNGQLYNEVSSVRVSLFQQCSSYQALSFDWIISIRVFLILPISLRKYLINYLPMSGLHFHFNHGVIKTLLSFTVFDLKAY